MAVLPFPQSELEGVSANLLSQIFDGGASEAIGGRPLVTTREDYTERIVLPSVPELLAGQTAQVLNVTAVAAPFGAPTTELEASL